QQVEEADRERRLGEDLLFASNPFRDKAQAHLSNAEKTYEQAKVIALGVRKALDLRDRVMADLPYYAQWLTRIPGTPSEPSLERATRTESAQDALFNFLAQQTPDYASLRKLYQEIDKDFSALREEKDPTLQSIVKGQRVQTEWDEIQSLLSVPLVEHSERVRH